MVVARTTMPQSLNNVHGERQRGKRVTMVAKPTKPAKPTTAPTGPTPVTQRVADAVWRALPVFRVVADAQSVTRAASALELSPAAVSRTVAQMEEELGRPLFDRAGRKIILNAQGEQLLEAVRQAQATVSRVLADLSDRDYRAVVRVGCVGQLGRVYLPPAIKEVAKQHAELRVSVSHPLPDAALDSMLSGALDLFLALNVTVVPPLLAHPLGPLALGVFVGRGHPLFAATNPTTEDMLEHSFVAQRRPPMMRSIWPTHLTRRITLEVDLHAVALEACLQGSHLMVMESAFAKTWVKEGQLRQLPFAALKPAELMLITHERTRELPVVSAVAAAIARAARSLTA
jgi:DNA-binding transcriptional LysR family regulator